jgi:hypothetical protein
MPVVSGGDRGLHDDSNPSEGLVRYGYVCMSPDPQLAWRLSGDMDWTKEQELWDLWQIRVADDDELHYRSDFGPHLVEIRAYTPIPPDRIWLVGTRDGEHPPALDYPPPGIKFAKKRKAKTKKK